MRKLKGFYMDISKRSRSDHSNVYNSPVKERSTVLILGEISEMYGYIMRSLQQLKSYHPACLWLCCIPTLTDSYPLTARLFCFI